MQPQLAMMAGLFFLTAVGIAWWQQRAKTCSLHNRQAGRIAWFLSEVCLFVGTGLLVLAVLWR